MGRDALPSIALACRTRCNARALSEAARSNLAISAFEGTKLIRTLSAAVVISVLGILPLTAVALDAPTAERLGPNHVRIHWLGEGPVDVYISVDPDAGIVKENRVARNNTAGVYDLKKKFTARPYFTLRDDRDGNVLRVAERILPLEQGSNFRDVGGYPAAEGKHIRWGKIYRSAATPMLTDGDYRYLARLDIKADIDLRSTDERLYSPDNLPQHTGAHYFSGDYRFSATSADYRDSPTSLAPQFRELFQALLHHEGAVTYHCSAGQDRTGIATALVLSALGVPRDVIVQDYLLSMQYQRAQYEFQRLDPAKYPGNTFAEFIAKIPESEFAADLAARPYLYDSAGEPFLEETFKVIDSRWGNVGNYLERELGVGSAEIAQLRAIYLE
jgi:protein-tyrosine phosphatase